MRSTSTFCPITIADLLTIRFEVPALLMVRNV